MKKFFKRIFLFVLFSSVAILAQDSLIAEIGSQKLTVPEFRNRFELNPQTYPKSVNGYSPKQILLYSIIAEKLWALDARQRGYDTTEIMKTSFKVIKNMFVRDALYKIEVSEKIKISESEILDSLNRRYTKLKVKYLFEKDSAGIYNLYNQLNEGISFDSLLIHHNQIAPEVEIKSGDFVKPVEDALYKLNVNKYTGPVKSDKGWFIFKIEGKIKTDYKNEELESVVQDIKKEIKELKAKSLIEEFRKEFFAGKKVETDSYLFESISNKIYQILRDRKNMENLSDSVNVYLKNEDMIKIEDELGPDTLKMNFIKFQSNPYSVRDFLRYFFFDGFYSNKISPEIIESKLNFRIKQIIEDELLAREGYRRGLENLPEVKASIGMWEDNYLAKLRKDILIDSIKVGNEVVYNYYQQIKNEKNPDDIQVNILEILSDDIKVINNALKQIKAGADFRKLASKFTKRKWTKNRGGEFGFFPSSMYGKIGVIASGMKIGEIYGPLKTPDGYSIFKLIGKKEKTPKVLPPFNDVKENLRKELLGIKRSDFFIDYTVKLADKFGVTINQKLFSALELKNLSMYTYRYMGFGGRINAVPATLPFAEWFKAWNEEKKVVP